MKTVERREVMLQHRQRHIKQLQKLGYIYSNLNAVKMVEHQANWYATQECNGDITESEANKAYIRITYRVRRLFGGRLPKGFFINTDPRGYALKLDNEKWQTLPVNYQDWGGYMILAPEEF